MASQNCWLLWLRTMSLLDTQHVGALQWAALLVYRGLCCSLWFWLGYFGENVTWHARVTPLAMGGWGNAIMLRPINCYLLRQTDFFFKKLIVYFVMLQLSVCAMIGPKHMEKVTRISSQSSSKCFLFVCLFALHESSLELCFLTSWPALTSDPPPPSPTPTKLFPNFPQKQIPADWQQFVKDSDLLPIKHFESLQEPNVLSIIIGYWKCS